MTDLADAPPGRSSSPASPRFLHDVYDAASECNKCSLCQAVCPTYVTNPVEWETARGRVSLIRDAIEGRLDLRDIDEGPLSTCLTCDNCVSACAPRVPTALIVSRARQELVQQEGQSWRRSFALHSVLPRPGMLRLVHRVSRAAQATGLHGLARRTGMTRWLGTVGAFADHIGPLEARTARDRIADLPAAAEPVRGRLGFLVCCYQNLAFPAATEATMRVLLANGFELVVPELGCSGLPAKVLGDREAEVEMAVRTTNEVRRLEVDGFIGDVAACTRHWQDHGDLLKDDRATAGAARDFSAQVWFASHLLAERGMVAPLGPLRWKVAFDEPCSYPLDASVRSAPYRLLDQVPGLSVQHLPEAAMCCGGPGEYFHREPERSAAILQRKFENVRASGAEVLVTENVSCLAQLRQGAALHAPEVRVMHLFELLEAAMTTAARPSSSARAASRRTPRTLAGTP